MSNLKLDSMVLTLEVIFESVDRDYWNAIPIRQIQLNMLNSGMLETVRDGGYELIGSYEGLDIRVKADISWNQTVKIRVKGFNTLSKLESIVAKITENVQELREKDRSLLIKTILKPKDKGAIMVNKEKLVETIRKLVNVTDYIIAELTPVKIGLTNIDSEIEVEVKKEQVKILRLITNMEKAVETISLTDKIIDQILEAIEVVSLAE